MTLCSESSSKNTFLFHRRIWFKNIPINGLINFSIIFICMIWFMVGFIHPLDSITGRSLFLNDTQHDTWSSCKINDHTRKQSYSKMFPDVNSCFSGLLEISTSKRNDPPASKSKRTGVSRGVLYPVIDIFGHMNLPRVTLVRSVYFQWTSCSQESQRTDFLSLLVSIVQTGHLLSLSVLWFFWRFAFLPFKLHNHCFLC